MATKLTIPRKTKKSRKREAKADEEDTAEQEHEAPVPLVTHQKTFCIQFFLMLKCKSTASNFTSLMDCMRTSLIFPTTSRGLSVNTKVFCTARDTTMRNFLKKLWQRLCLHHFLEGERKRLTDSMASFCMVN